jgi:adenosylmethionine---8-amino-7-oxononanoate aminotransferase
MNHIWYPFTQMKTAPHPHKVASGKGAVLTLEDGRKLIDCISSWWVNLLGHAHPEISSAIHAQSMQLEHVIFAGFSHEPAERLAKELVKFLPKPLNKVFFSDNGSTAVEVALKIAYQYWANRGEKREKFLCFEGSYHGDTVGAMSLGNQPVFWRIFEKLLFQKVSVPYPATYPGDLGVEERERQILNEAEKILEREKFAAVVIEPLVQGVSGMQMCRTLFLQKLEALVRKTGALLIYDEVMTGFGRTGDWFACVKSETKPDLICLAKGITGGFLPLAVTVATDEIFQAFCSDDPAHTFYHGHSYTANPLGCAAASATLNLLEKNPSCFKGMEERHRPYLEKLKEHPRLQKVRSCGTIVAMDVVTENSDGYLDRAGSALREYFFNKGLLIRPLGNVIYLLPPYCVTDEQLDIIYDAIDQIPGHLLAST